MVSVIVAVVIAIAAFLVGVLFGVHNPTIAAAIAKVGATPKPVVPPKPPV